MSKRMSRRKFLSCAALGSLAIAERTRAVASAAAGATKPFEFGTAPGVDSSALFVAIDKGFFAKHGIDGKVNLFPTGVEMINAMTAGKIFAATVGTVVFFTSVTKGLPIQIMGVVHGNASAENYSSSSIVAGPNAGVGKGEIAKLKGKKVGTPLGTDGEGALRAFLKSANVSHTELQVINIRPADMVSALQQGSIDAFCVFEPWPSLAITQVTGSVRVNTAVAPTFGPGIFITTPDVIKSNRDLLVAFLAAFAEAQQWARQNKGELVQIIRRYVTGLSEAAVNEALNYVRFDCRMSRFVVDGFKNKTIPDLVGLQVIKEAFDPAKSIDYGLMVEVQKTYPQFFSDLPPIPANAQL